MLPLSSTGIVVLVGLGLPAAGIFFGEIKDASRRERKYQDQLAEYEKMVRADRVRVQRERIKAAYLRREATKLDQIHARTVSVLRAVYDKNICFPKYRNFVAMWTIYEYICSGRCYTLEGENGAYNLYEMESRMDRILTKLDDVIKLLQKIKDQQFMLYHAIQDSNQKQQEILTAANHCADQIAQMGRNLSTISQQIDRQSAISQYQSEQTVKELEYMNRMNLFAGNYGSRS